MAQSDSAETMAAKSWLRHEIAAGRRRAMPAIALGVAQTILAIGQIFCASRLLAAVLHPANQGMFLATAGFILAAVLRAGLTILQERLAKSLGTGARRRLRNAALSSLLQLGFAGLRGRHSAELAGVVVDRIEALDGLFGRWIPAAALLLVSPALVVLAASMVDWRTALILAVTGLLVPMAMALAGIGAAAASRRQFTALTRLQTRFIDRVRGISTIVLAGRAEAEATALGEAADELRRRTMRVLRVAFLSSTALDLASAAALVGIAIRFAAPLRAGHLALVPTALFALLLVPEFFASFRNFSAVYQDRMTAQAAAEGLATLPRAETLDPPAATEAALPIRTVAAQGVAIAFEDVSFAWSDARGPVFSHLSFRLPAGETMMLVGPSGSGKSTIIELLLGGVRPQSGRITINGAPIESIVPAALARLTALISQKPFLFAGSIADNIRLGLPEASDEAVQRAAERAHVTAFTDALPDGLNSRIGDGGFGVSGGQAQRIAIARAFLKDAQLLLLDEPTAQLDPATERDVLEALRRLTLGRTVILATHAAFAHEFSGRKLDLGARTDPRLDRVS
ncbi:MAG: thiol reductant ABC exporter subunit CydD [Acidiphilium sp.]